MPKRKPLEDAGPGALALKMREVSMKKYGDSNVEEFRCFKESLYGLPLAKNLALQYIFGVDILPLSRCGSIVGPTGSTKSSLLWYFMKLNLEYGGLGLYLPTEMKDNPDQIRAIVQNDDMLEKKVITAKSRNLEQLMNYLFYYAELYNELDPEHTTPMLMGIDSLNAVTSKEANEARQSGKDASGRQGQRNALNIQESLQSYNPECLEPNPFSLIVVNHQKVKPESNPKPFAPAAKTDPGGEHKNFMYTWKLELTKAGKEKDVRTTTPLIKMQLSKSGMGFERPNPIIVPYRSYFTPVETEEGFVQTIAYDWDTALVRLLDNVSKTDLKDIFDINIPSKVKASSDYFGLKDVSHQEMGEAIHNDPEVTKKLQDMLYIRRHKKFNQLEKTDESST